MVAESILECSTENVRSGYLCIFLPLKQEWTVEYFALSRISMCLVPYQSGLPDIIWLVKQIPLVLVAEEPIP